MINNYTVNVANTSLYKEFMAMKDEIMKHKWYESEKNGYDIGFAKALINWTIKFKTEWVQNRKKKN
jgi:hypothetical protein